MLSESWRDVEDVHLPVSFNTVAVLISPVFSEFPQLLSSIGVLSQGWRDVAEYNIAVSLNSICSHLSGLLRDSPIPILFWVGVLFQTEQMLKRTIYQFLWLSVLISLVVFPKAPQFLSSIGMLFQAEKMLKKKLCLIFWIATLILSLVVFPEDSCLQFQWWFFRVERSTCYPVFLNNYRHLSSRLPLGSATPINNKWECSLWAEDAVSQ